jgi:signal transduction histidine kinase
VPAKPSTVRPPGSPLPTDILAVAAHELRHPLHLMRMSLARHLPDDGTARAALERHIQRMARLIDDLVDFVRTEQDALELQRETLDVHEFLLGLMDDYRTSFDARQVRLSIIAPVGIRIRVDAHRLLQVFSNLLDNALKFTPAGGAVVIEATSDGRHVSIAVRDNGRGLAPEVIAHAFEFPTTLARANGLGIGLSVARRIIERHGGHISVRSAGVGHGTEAVVRLPMIRS